ncbi:MULTISPECIES: SLC13 family permease [Candidatus Nitrosocaldus]|jgi:Na+/H+ antiporter NhaD/arsenite permease-like protein|uniref:Arsenical pump membrane protein, ArsB n=1 Tax=Candidatus Nitrosocaldus cavascurensis TaxID=2058097 RepID=A0A2K5APY8_9ARCH|nr:MULTISPECIES: SLC13 family permease [Candidatus Nitrosocaldus]SPC33713.1 Arsenical pump membrane protein, ArsB [Candidatus Nitrosocaldus cavascurensis]
MTAIYALLTFLLVYGLIAVRRVGRFSIPVWIPMLIGALVMLATQTISIEQAYKAVKMDVIIFLLGMFMIVAVLERAGIIQHITVSILKRTRSMDRLLFFILVVMGTLSAFLMNDTIALVATPILVGMSRFGINPKPLLIVLAFAVTIGSAMTPIGNPQNFLISVESGMKAPMLEFIKYLALPTITNYIVTYYLLRWYYRNNLKDMSVNITLYNDDHDPSKSIIYEPRMAKISIFVVSAVILGFFMVSIARAIGLEPMLDMSHIALVGGLFMLAYSRDRVAILKHMNWGIIVLFITMFVFMDALSKAGIIAMIADMLSPLQLDSDASEPTSPSTILAIVSTSTFLSQFMSNVPFVAFYLNVMHEQGFSSDDIKAWVTLAGASTLAGNLTILGAASNLIILEAARKDGFTFLEFFKIGSLVTLANMLILLTFLLVIP